MMPVKPVNPFKPVRLTLSRRKGFNLQRLSIETNGLPAVNVARPTKWGNPFVVQFDPHTDYSPQTAEDAVRMFRDMIGRDPQFAAAAQQLHGKNLACWCKESPCHADVLLSIANL